MDIFHIFKLYAHVALILTLVFSCISFRLTSSLSVHMNSVHSDQVGIEPRWKCEICSKVFKKKENLIGHRDSIHHGLKNFQCDICSKFGFNSFLVYAYSKIEDIYKIFFLLF